MAPTRDTIPPAPNVVTQHQTRMGGRITKITTTNKAAHKSSKKAPLQPHDVNAIHRWTIIEGRQTAVNDEGICDEETLRKVRQNHGETEEMATHDPKYRGSTPSRGRNESYHGGAKDGLFGRGRATVPHGLSDKAAGAYGGDDDPDKRGESGGASGGDGGGGGGGGGDDNDKISTEGRPTESITSSDLTS